LERISLLPAAFVGLPREQAVLVIVHWLVLLAK
jgi:hypothetical protein